ncbi:MAG: phospho-sugar mutase [Proteobacteria bacterium]|nr:phospho-sugar mutase [Pseudomonadota bacterium]
MTIEPSILARATYWASNPIFDQGSRREITNLIETHNIKELMERFYRDLEFGTGGLRGIMGPGTNRMNIYNIRKATTALALQIISVHGGSKTLKVAVSYDSRNMSREFAMAACEVLAAHKIESLITEELRPTPMLSFMVRHFNCQAGICVTASHNPAEYNGYKVYWDTGAQIISPHDQAIIARYSELAKYEDLPLLPFSEALTIGLAKFVGKELDDAYFAKIETLSLRKDGRDNFKIVYTPLHGSGLFPVTECLKRFGFKQVLVVPEQQEPNGNFPTVKYPNPEDPEALGLALNLAKKERADLVLGTDPDSDRIGIIVRENDVYTFFNGNQLGCLLVDYFLAGLKALDRMPKNPLVIKTIVTTDLQADIARGYGAECEETLTGFKWICGLIEDYESGRRKPYRKYVCGGEESYGFLADSFVRDKDAVSACCIASEMVAYHKSRGFTCSEVLAQIFQRHGLYQESLFTITMPGIDGAQAIKQMMTGLRTNPPTVIDGINVETLRDYANSQEVLLRPASLNPPGTLTLPKSDVLQFILTDGTKVSVRPSGTEPKIKFYVSVRDLSAKGANLERVRALQEFASSKLVRIEQEFVRLARG